jgi:hypothetical protein
MLIAEGGQLARVSRPVPVARAGESCCAACAGQRCHWFTATQRPRRQAWGGTVSGIIASGSALARASCPSFKPNKKATHGNARPGIRHSAHGLSHLTGIGTG